MHRSHLSRRLGSAVLFFLSAFFTAIFAVPAYSETVPATTAKSPQPKAISPAERDAVRWSAHFLASGDPAIWWDALAASAPLRALGRDAALAEIGMRLGPAAGAGWTLFTPLTEDESYAVFHVEFPSGIDDFVTLKMVEEDGWKIYSLESLIDHPAAPPASAAAGPPPASSPKRPLLSPTPSARRCSLCAMRWPRA